MGIGPEGVAIIGNGQAGFQVAASLREGGYDGRIRLLGEEPGLPYQRPPLSKAFLLGGGDQAPLRLRPEGFFEQNRIEHLDNSRVIAIDREAKRLTLAGGARLGYGHLVLATGARNRVLAVPGAELAGILSLRSVAEAEALRQALRGGGELVVVGAGFIGLEVTAVAAELGAPVHVLEATQKPMGRVVSDAVSAAFTAYHRKTGVAFSLGAGVARFLGERGTVRAVETTSGQILPARLVLVAIGVSPEHALAQATGLATGNGIIVDDRLLTCDPAVSAIGDCALHPNRFAGGVARLESVQNATDQGRAVAARLLGKGTTYDVPPWFWSDQGKMKLQIAGLTAGSTSSILRGEPETGAFSVYCFRDGALAAVETVNRPAEHIAARKLLEAGGTVTPDEAADPAFDLRARAAAARKAR